MRCWNWTSSSGLRTCKESMKWFAFILAAATIALATFLVVGIRMLSPKNCSAQIRLIVPRGAVAEKRFELCMYAGNLYFGTLGIDRRFEIGGDPFRVSHTPL